jgi:hypothetical protein
LSVRDWNAVADLGAERTFVPLCCAGSVADDYVWGHLSHVNLLAWWAAPGAGAAEVSVAPAVDDLQVVLPVPGAAGELPLTLEGVLAERSGEALVEPGVVAPDAQDAVLE